MDQLIKKLKASGTGCHIGHEYLRCLGHADDPKLVCLGIKGLQKIISICEKFGEKYIVKYNEKKSICISFDRAKDRNSYFNDNVNIILNGSRMKCANSVKDLGNYIAYDLSESEEIRHKKTDFIWRANGILVKY